MTPGQLDQAHTELLRKHWRALVDSGGRATPGYLTDLAAIADAHAREAVAALGHQPAATGSDITTQPAAGGQPEDPPAAPKAGRPAPRRASARGQRAASSRRSTK